MVQSRGDLTDSREEVAHAAGDLQTSDNLVALMTALGRQKPSSEQAHAAEGAENAHSSVAADVETAMAQSKSDGGLRICTRDSPMCEVTGPSDVGLSGSGSQCATCEFATPLSRGSAGNMVFTGGSGCSGGNNICTCSHFGSELIRRETFGRGGAGDPGTCAAACEAEKQCQFAFYRRASGGCFLLRACPSLVSTWVGSWGSAGGVTYRKWQRPLKVDAGENNWPVKWFGKYTRTPWTEASMPVSPTAPAWDTVGTNPGYDWSLPPTVTQSKYG